MRTEKFGQPWTVVEALIEWQNGQWYWDREPVETDAASCEPSF